MFYYKSMKATLLARLDATAQAPYPYPETSVPAGFPSPAQDYRAISIDLNDILIKDKAATYILRVSGHSMVDAGISDGDEIIVDRSLQPRPGNIVVAALNGEFTVKRFHIDQAGVGWLYPENPQYSPLQINEESDFTIFGVVTRCLHHV